MFKMPGSRAIISARIPQNGNLVGINYYTSTQTVVVPKGATRALVRLVGGGGGAESTGNNSGIAVGGTGAYLEKFLTGLRSGQALTLTVGPGGGGGANGTATTLIVGALTLTAGGGSGANCNLNNAIILGSGGTATNGDLNLTGASGFGSIASDVNATGAELAGFSGAGPLTGQVSVAKDNASGTAAGVNYGGGAVVAATASNQSNSGAAGIAIIEWFS